MPQLTPQNWIMLLAISSMLIFQLEHTFSMKNYKTLKNKNFKSKTLKKMW